MNANAQRILNDLLVHLLPLIFAFSLHELGHAWVTVRLGDNTPKEDGTYSLNPAAHIDPIGTLALPIMQIVLFPSGYPPMGWPKPARFNSYRFSRRFRMSTAWFLTCAAGPVTSLLVALVTAVALQALLHYGRITSGTTALKVIESFMHVNIVLATFNLLPLPPADGGRALRALVPIRFHDTYETFEKIAPIALIVLMVSGVGSKLIYPPAIAIADAMYRFANVFFPYGAASQY